MPEQLRFYVPSTVTLPVVNATYPSGRILPGVLNGRPVKFTITYEAEYTGQRIVIECKPDPAWSARRTDGRGGPRREDIEKLIAAYSPVIQRLWDEGCLC